MVGKIIFDMIKFLLSRIYFKIRVFKYKSLSTCKNIIGKPFYVGPVLINGLGKVEFGNRVTLGIIDSPSFLSTYLYIEARRKSAFIRIEENVYISNNASIISEEAGILIGKNTLIGVNFSAMDSDFHELEPSKRMSGEQISKKIVIEENVFIGANVTVLKGVTIGENSVIGSNSVVSKSIPKNVIACGNPCRILKEL